MKQRKIPMRTCVISHEQAPKGELLRIVKDKDNNVFVDVSGKKNGRGAYIKKDIDILNKAKKTKILDKKLECVIPEDVYDEIEKLI